MWHYAGMWWLWVVAVNMAAVHIISFACHALHRGRFSRCGANLRLTDVGLISKGADVGHTLRGWSERVSMWGIPCGVDLKECTHVDTYIALRHCIAFAIMHWDDGCGSLWYVDLMSGEDQSYIWCWDWWQEYVDHLFICYVVVVYSMVLSICGFVEYSVVTCVCDWGVFIVVWIFLFVDLCHYLSHFYMSSVIIFIVSTWI